MLRSDGFYGKGVKGATTGGYSEQIIFLNPILVPPVLVS